MKRKILLFSVFIAFFASGCGEGNYRAEKMFWQANAKLQRLSAAEDKDSMVKSKEFERIIFAFKEITMRYPYWEDTPKVHFMLADLYMMKNEVALVKKEYDSICKKFPDKEVFCVEALKNLGGLYEKENDWLEAEKAYTKIIEKYPYTAIGLIMPFNLAQQYQKRGETEKKRKILQDAFENYKGIIEENKNSPLLTDCIDYSIICIFELDGAEKAVHFLKSLQGSYVNSATEALIMFNIAKIYQNKLNRKKEAVKYYKQIIKKYSENAEYASKALKSLAEIYERENNWGKAERIYKRIVNKYSYSNAGLIIPFYLAQHYKVVGQEEKAKSAFCEAVQFYEKVIKDNQLTLAAIGAVDFAAMCIFNVKGAEETIRYLQALKDKYPDATISTRAVFNIARIYNVELKNKKEAIKYYQQIIDKCPNVKLAEEARKEIKKLSE